MATGVSATTGGMPYDGSQQGVSGGAVPYVLVSNSDSGSGDNTSPGIGYSWVPASTIGQPGVGTPVNNPSDIHSNIGSIPSGGVAVTQVGTINEKNTGVWGPVFQDQSGNYYGTTATPQGDVMTEQKFGLLNGTTSPTGVSLTPQQIQTSMQGYATANAETQANSNVFNSLPGYVAAGLLGFGLAGAGPLANIGQSIGTAGAAGASGAAAGDVTVGGSSLIGVPDAAGAGMTYGADGSIVANAAGATAGAVGGTGATASNFGNLLNSTSAVDPLTGLPADATQTAINSIGTSANTGLPDLGTGLPTTPGMAGTSTGNAAIDSYLTNSGVNLANSGGALVPGLGSAAAMPELGSTSGVSVPGVSGATTVPSGTVPGGTGAGSSGGSGAGGTNLGSLAGISALIPGLAMIGSVAAGNKGADTSNLSGIADTLKANAGTTKPDTSGLTADAAALTGPNSTEALLTSQAQSLIPSVSTGNLPPGAQTLVHNALNDATNSIKSKYAQLGLTGSTMESQELAQANSNAQAQAFQYGQQLTNTGIAEAGAASADINSAANIQSQIISSGLAAAGLSATDLSQSAAIYDEIMKTQVAQDTALQQALANFASASAIGIGLAAGGGGSGSNSSGIVNSLSGLGTGFSNLLSSIGTGASNLFSSATS